MTTRPLLPAWDRLRGLRGRARLSRAALADLVGFSASGLQRYEDARYEAAAPVELVSALARALVGRGDPPIKREEVFALLPEPLHELLPLETADALAASTRLLERLFVEPSLSEDLRREIAERVLANARALKTEGGR